MHLSKIPDKMGSMSIVVMENFESFSPQLLILSPFGLAGAIKYGIFHGNCSLSYKRDEYTTVLNKHKRNLKMTNYILKDTLKVKEVIIY